MALVVFLRGVNVGGHRTFRPSVLAAELKPFDVVNVGAAGTFVVRKAVGRGTLRAELARRLPFETDVMICGGRDILRIASENPFAGQASGPDVVHFVSVLPKRRAAPTPLPLDLPPAEPWCLRVLGCKGRFVFGLHRREMKAIGHLGRLEKVFGAPLTTRNWNTILAVTRVLSNGGAAAPEE
jgi:uncharacterized protein (DUF1697 family)